MGGKNVLVPPYTMLLTATRSSSGGHFVKIFCRFEHGKIGGSFDLIGWKQNMFYFHPIHKVSETCQKLAFTHPFVVLKSGLKNNWMKKLHHVNRPLNGTLSS